MTDLAVQVPPIPASVYVACPATWCPAFAVQRLVWLKQVAVGVIAIPQLMCQTCHSVLHLPLSLDLEETPVPKLHADREPTSRHDIAPWTPLAGGPSRDAAAVAAVVPADVAPAETTDAPETPAAPKARKATPRKKAGDS